ncbi:MAG TPA: PEP-CTERM sorting domain-containing protein [Caulobacteraceae bacterium]|jgi:hypothetical protein
MKNTILAPIFGAAMVAGMASAGAAGAVTMETFDLSINGCSSTCFGTGVTSLGTVTVTEDAGALDFSVDLSGAAFNVAGKSGTHHSLSFNIESTGTTDPVTGVGIAVSSTTPDFTGSTAGGFKASPFGTFEDAVDYTGSLKSNGTSNPTSLSFVVTDSQGNLTLDNLTANSVTSFGKIYLAADVFANRQTGNVGAPGGTISIATPEPGSWALMVIGVGLMGASLRTRRRNALALAPARI